MPAVLVACANIHNTASYTHAVLHCKHEPLNIVASRPISAISSFMIKPTALRCYDILLLFLCFLCFAALFPGTQTDDRPYGGHYNRLERVRLPKPRHASLRGSRLKSQECLLCRCHWAGASACCCPSYLRRLAIFPALAASDGSAPQFVLQTGGSQAEE